LAPATARHRREQRKKSSAIDSSAEPDFGGQAKLGYFNLGSSCAGA